MFFLEIPALRHILNLARKHVYVDDELAQAIKDYDEKIEQQRVDRELQLELSPYSCMSCKKKIPYGQYKESGYCSIGCQYGDG